MPRTAYYHFFPVKEDGEATSIGNIFPLHPTRYEIVEFRDENPILLNLFDQWEIRKELTALDVGSLGALVLDQDLVFSHIFKYWPKEVILGLLRRGEQVPIVIRDLDTKTEHNSYLKKSSIDESGFVISTIWTRDFVYRRDLVIGDVIGLYWHVSSSSFCFSVLKRAGSTSD